MRKAFLSVLFLAGAAAVPNAAVAGLFSATGPVIAIIAGELFLGEGEGHIDGSGTLVVHSQKDPGMTCRGQFTSSGDVGGIGTLRCSDSTTAIFSFQRLSLMRGHGVGSMGTDSLSFAYGLTADEAGPYLKLPAGKKLVRNGTELTLVSF